MSVDFEHGPGATWPADDPPRDRLTYSVHAHLAHAASGASFTDRAEAIETAEQYRRAGWSASIAIYGEVDGFETWRSLALSPHTEETE